MNKLSQCPHCLCVTRSIPTIEKCEKCDEIKAGFIGVSQWRNMGKRYGYWNFFEKLQREKILKKIEKWNESGYFSDCIGEHGWKELLKFIKS